MVVRFAGRGPFDGSGRVLVGTYDRGVHRDHPVGAVKTRSQVPSTAHIRSRLWAPPVPVFLRQVDPLRPGLELEGDRVDHLAMVSPPAAAFRRPVRE